MSVVRVDHRCAQRGRDDQFGRSAVLCRKAKSRLGIRCKITIKHMPLVTLDIAGMSVTRSHSNYASNVEGAVSSMAAHHRLGAQAPSGNSAAAFIHAVWWNEGSAVPNRVTL